MKCNSQNQLPAMGMATQDSNANSKMKFDTTKKVTDAGTNTAANKIAVFFPRTQFLANEGDNADELQSFEKIVSH